MVVWKSPIYETLKEGKAASIRGGFSCFRSGCFCSYHKTEEGPPHPMAVPLKHVKKCTPKRTPNCPHK